MFATFLATCFFWSRFAVCLAVVLCIPYYCQLMHSHCMHTCRDGDDREPDDRGAGVRGDRKGVRGGDPRTQGGVRESGLVRQHGMEVLGACSPACVN